MRSASWGIALVLSASAAGPVVAETRAPPLGDVRYAGSIDGAGDTDEFAGALIAGETLRVRATARRGSSLVPRVEIVDPSGAVSAATPRLDVPASGVWTVRIAGAEGTVGAYEVRVAVAGPRRVRTRGQLVGGGATLVARHAFDAVDGATLSLRVSSRGPGAPVVPSAIVPPAAEPFAVSSDAFSVRGATTELRGLTLASGAGRYAVELMASEGGAAYSLRLRVTPPPRPRGRVALSAEPRLAPRAEPLEGVPGAVVRLAGAHFAAAPPRSRVWFGDAEASVAAATSVSLDVVAPPGAEGDVVGVTVQNPDGQAVTRPAQFRYVSDEPLALASLDPATAILQPGATRRFSVTLTRRAPPLGAAVSLAATGPIGELSSVVHVPPGESSAAFDLVAAAVPAEGRIDASFGGAVLSAGVTIVPPAALVAISPGPVTLPESVTQRFTVLLESPAPPAGIDVALSATGGIGALPAFVRIGPFAAGAEFDLVTSKTRASGVIRAEAANAVETAVTVAPPSSVDVSGWKIEQTNAARSFALPAGTVLSEGGYLVVGRNATRAEFEAFWSRTLGPAVVYVNALDQGPSINGSETFELRDAAGLSVDGPTAPMPSAAATVMRRIPGTSAAAAASWSSSAASTVSNATPGSGQSAPAQPAGIYVSEFADAVGSGNYVYEFVEIHFDRLP